MVSVLARNNMVYNQVRPNRVYNMALLQALQSIPRERFLPPHLQSLAYCDRDLVYQDQRFLMAPMTFAQLLESAAIENDHRVLIIACGTGYSLAVTAHICKNVIGVENMPTVASQARQNINHLNLPNVSVVDGPLLQGWPSGMPYHAIIIEGAVEAIPTMLTEQLVNGGRLVTILRKNPHPYVLGKGVIITKNEKHFTQTETFDAGTTPLPDFKKPQVFQF